MRAATCAAPVTIDNTNLDDDIAPTVNTITRANRQNLSDNQSGSDHRNVTTDVAQDFSNVRVKLEYDRNQNLPSDPPNEPPTDRGNYDRPDDYHSHGRNRSDSHRSRRDRDRSDSHHRRDRSKRDHRSRHRTRSSHHKRRSSRSHRSNKVATPERRTELPISYLSCNENSKTEKQQTNKYTKKLCTPDDEEQQYRRPSDSSTATRKLVTPENKQYSQSKSRERDIDPLMTYNNRYIEHASSFNLPQNERYTQQPQYCEYETTSTADNLRRYRTNERSNERYRYSENQTTFNQPLSYQTSLVAYGNRYPYSYANDVSQNNYSTNKTNGSSSQQLQN